MESIETKPKYTVYCHFSFRRTTNLRESGEAIFAVAFYSDQAGERLLYKEVTKLKMWQDHQFVTAIQSYENALRVISKCQGAMIHNNIVQIMLVTDNSTLAGWIENPKKNKAYTEYMQRAVSQYKSGAAKEIVLGVGLCEARESEKSYKYCNERYIEELPESKVKVLPNGKHVIDIDAYQGGYKPITQIAKEQNKMPEVVGITEITEA